MTGMKHCIRAQQWNRADLDGLFKLTDYMRTHEKEVIRDAPMRGRIMVTYFYEASTRTRMSTEAAWIKLGGSAISTDNAGAFSSAAKGESLEDSIRVIAGYADVIVLRHFESGAAERAALVSSVPIINAGDGPGQHPTQALLDLYTVKRELGRISGLTYAMVGDLLYGRTVKSLAYLLAKNYRVKKIFLVAPEQVRMPAEIIDFLKSKGVAVEETDDLHATLKKCNVVYQTRIQKERFIERPEDYEAVRGVYVIGREEMAMMRPYSILMHPLPRLDEIATEVDGDLRAAYFRQAHNGLYVRMALLRLLVPD